MLLLSTFKMTLISLQHTCLSLIIPLQVYMDICFMYEYMCSYNIGSHKVLVCY